MASEKMGLFFLVVSFTYFCLFANSSSLHKPLLPDSLQEHNGTVTGMDGHNVTGFDGGVEGGNSLVGHRKFARGGGVGARGGGARGGGEVSGGGGGGGSSGTGDNQNGGANDQGGGGGGAAVVPVIVAGAANNNRHPNSHRGAANRNQNCIGLPALIITTLATSIVHLFAVL